MARAGPGGTCAGTHRCSSGTTIGVTGSPLRAPLRVAWFSCSPSERIPRCGKVCAVDGDDEHPFGAVDLERETRAEYRDVTNVHVDKGAVVETTVCKDVIGDGIDLHDRRSPLQLLPNDEAQCVETVAGMDERE